MAGRAIHSEEQFRRNVESPAEPLNLVFVELAFAVKYFRDDARCAKHVHQVFLQKTVLVHEESQRTPGTGGGKLIVLFLKVLDKRGQKLSQLLLGSAQLCASGVEILQYLRVPRILVLGLNDFWADLGKQGAVFALYGEIAHRSHAPLLYSACVSTARRKMRPVR